MNEKERLVVNRAAGIVFRRYGRLIFAVVLIVSGTLLVVAAGGLLR